MRLPDGAEVQAVRSYSFVQHSTNGIHAGERKNVLRNGHVQDWLPRQVAVAGYQQQGSTSGT